MAEDEASYAEDEAPYNVGDDLSEDLEHACAAAALAQSGAHRASHP